MKRHCKTFNYARIILGSLILLMPFVSAALAQNDVSAQEPNSVVALRQSILQGPYGTMSIGELVSKTLKERGPRRRDMRLALVMRKNDTVPELIHRLREKSDDETYDALMLIQGSLRWRETAPQILELLRDKNRSEHVRGRSATAAALFELREAVPTIRDLLQNAKESQVRQMAIMALGVLQDSNSIELIKRNLDVESPYVRVRAAMALGMLGSGDGKLTALELAQHENFGMRCLAAEALASFPDEESTARLKEMLEHDTSPTVRSEVAEHLGRFEIQTLPRKQAVKRLKELLDPENPNPPRWAFQYLADHFGHEAKPFLGRLAEKSARLQGPAVRALIYIDSGIVQMQHKQRETKGGSENKQ